MNTAVELGQRGCAALPGQWVAADPSRQGVYICKVDHDLALKKDDLVGLWREFILQFVEDAALRRELLASLGD